MGDFTGLFVRRKDVDCFRQGFTDSRSGAEDLEVSWVVWNGDELTFALPPIPKTPT